MLREEGHHLQTLGVHVRGLALALLLLTSAQAWALVGTRAFGQAPADSMSVTLNIAAAPPDTSSYFWAQQFFPDSSVDHGGYFGLQTGGIIGSQVVGRMVIFSIWNASAAEAGPGATAQTFGGEGVGYSVRMPFAWQQGVPYTFQLAKDGDFWWRLTLSQPDAEPLYLGRIRITQNVALTPGFANFTEYFREIDCAAMPAVRAIYSDLRIGSTVLEATDPGSWGPCANVASASVIGGAGVLQVGQQTALPFTATAIVSGDAAQQTIVGDLLPHAEDAGRVGHVFAGAVLPNGSTYLLSSQGWALYDPSSIRSAWSGPMTTSAIELVRQLDLRALAGTRVYLGYGLGQSAASAFADLLARQTLRLVHSVR